MSRQTTRSILHVFGIGLTIVATLSLTSWAAAQQQPAQPTRRAGNPPLFFSEPWKHTGPEHQSPLNQDGVTNPNLELKLYDPNAKHIPMYRQHPPPGSVPADWAGPSCILSAALNENRPSMQGRPSNPVELFTGVCQTAVALALRDRTNYVDLTGLAMIRWVARTSGFHVVRPIVKLADGTWLVGDHADGGQTANSALFLESEVPIATIRWFALDISRVVTMGRSWVDKPDLSKVDEVGFADLLPGSGHGWGGLLNFARIEVYGTPVKR